MSTYRTGNHWGVTIVREDDPADPNDGLVGSHLVAVVVNGDTVFAERICALLNGDDPARALLEDLADPNPCWYDHHGYCQAHGWMATEPRCPNARVKELLDGESR